MNDTATPTVPTPEEIDAAKAVFAAAGIPLNPPNVDPDEIEDDVLDRVGLFRDEYPEILRDTVRGQVLALLSAETREGVRCATNALHDALVLTRPEEPAEESGMDRILAFMATPAGQSLTAMALQYMAPAVPQTPNLTVTGPSGCTVVVSAADRTLVYRIIGASGVVAAAVPKQALTVTLSLDPQRVAAVVLDFTEESHELDALAVIAAAPTHEPITPDAPAPKDGQ